MHDPIGRSLAADVFVMPSLGEGGPIVTDEAAVRGLPILSPPRGAGRIGDAAGAMIVVDPARRGAPSRMTTGLAEPVEPRAELGRTARTLAMGVDWHDIRAPTSTRRPGEPSAANPVPSRPAPSRAGDGGRPAGPRGASAAASVAASATPGDPPDTGGTDQAGVGVDGAGGRVST